MTIQEIIEEIKTKTAVELCDLVHALEEEFGVSAAAAVVAGPAAGAEAAAAEEKSEFNVVLKDASSPCRRYPAETNGSQSGPRRARRTVTGRPLRSLSCSC